MADFKIVKKIVIDKLSEDPKWKNNPEGIRKLVARIINAIENSECNLQLLKNKINDNQEVAKIILRLCEEQNISSRILSNLKKINYKPEDIVLSKFNDDVKKNSDKVAAKFPMLNTQPSNAISKAKNNMYELFDDYGKSRDHTYDQMEKLIDDVRQTLHETYTEIQNERLDFFNRRIDRYCILSLISYIDICTYAIIGLLRSLIIDNRDIENKTIQLDTFKAYLCFEETNIKSNEEKDITYTSLRNDFTESEDNTDIIYLSLHAYLSMLSLVHEYDKIDDILLEEINSNQYRYFSSSIIDSLSVAEDDEQKIQIIVDEVMKLEESEKEEEEARARAKAKDNERKKRKAIPDKILKIKASLQKITKTTNKWIDPDNYLHIAVAFQEIYLSKSKYNKHTSMTTVRKIFNGNKTDEIDISDALFIDKKLIRGFFAVQGMIDEYKIFAEIENNLRHIFLKCYDNLFDISQCECAYSIADNSINMIHDILLRSYIVMNNI